MQLHLFLTEKRQVLFVEILRQNPYRNVSTSKVGNRRKVALGMNRPVI